MTTDGLRVTSHADGRRKLLRGQDDMFAEDLGTQLTLEDLVARLDHDECRAERPP